MNIYDRAVAYCLARGVSLKRYAKMSKLHEEVSELHIALKRAHKRPQSRKRRLALAGEIADTAIDLAVLAEAEGRNLEQTLVYKTELDSDRNRSKKAHRSRSKKAKASVRG